MTDPLEVFQRWLADAQRRQLPEPTAAALATCDTDGLPAVRMVLLKQADPRGFVFYTNLESDKGHHLRERPFAELCFYWNPPGRQVRVRGPVERVSDAEADTYFASRAYTSRLGAWASQQSRPLPRFAALERGVAAAALRYPPTGTVPRPPHWSGFRVVPNSIELWEEKPYRLHERVRHTHDPAHGWTALPLYP
jgi:pyridoxamine 5'-phosphate oxidase